jgi:lipid II:glycine glycyltransferase (peptidoglycan interpeptide bridge formation enzyme)
MYKDEIVAGTLFLEWQDTLYYKFNASKLTALSIRPSDLLIWEGIQYGKLNGYLSLDFGLSDWDQDGLIRFKRKFATEEKTISFLKYPAQDEPHPQEEQTQKLLHQLTNLLTDETVPDGITEKAGELMYRLFV